MAVEARDPSASGDVMLQKPDGSTTAYATLADAMQAAESGDTLILQNSITLDSSSTKVVENNGSLTLGGNVQLASSASPLGGSSVIAGNTPLKASHVRYVASGKFATAYLVAEPQAPAAGSFAAQDGQTVQDLLDGMTSPAVTIQFYGNTGNPAPVPAGEYSLQWALAQSPNGGSATQPTDPLENGTYRFEATAFDYTIPYEVEVSGLPAAPQEISAVSLTGLDAPIAGQLLDTAAVVETAGVTASDVTWSPNDSTAAFDTTYTATLTLTAESGYAFASSVSVTINGQSAQAEPQPDGTLSVHITFPKRLRSPSIWNPSLHLHRLPRRTAPHWMLCSCRRRWISKPATDRPARRMSHGRGRL